MDYLENLVFATDKEQIRKAHTSIIFQIANKLNKSFRSITNEEFERYGALAVIKNGEHYFDLHSKEDQYYGNAPLGVEPNDYYTRNTIEPDYILTGKKLVSFFKKFNLFPINKN